MAAVAACTAAPAVASLSLQRSRSSFRVSGATPKLAACNRSRVVMSASEKPRDIAGPAALALLVAAIVPDVAEAAIPGVSPSLKNLLLSVLSGGVIFGAIAGAVAGVSRFDPVKRK